MPGWVVAHFRGPFKELQDEFKIDSTPISPYNPKSNGLASSQEDTGGQRRLSRGLSIPEQLIQSGWLFTFKIVFGKKTLILPA